MYDPNGQGHHQLYYEDEEYNDNYHTSDNDDNGIGRSEFPWMSTTIVDDNSPTTTNGDEYMTASTKSSSPPVVHGIKKDVGPRLGDFASIFGGCSGRGPFG